MEQPITLEELRQYLIDLANGYLTPECTENFIECVLRYKDILQTYREVDIFVQGLFQEFELIELDPSEEDE